MNKDQQGCFLGTMQKKKKKSQKDDKVASFCFPGHLTLYIIKTAFVNNNIPMTISS